MASHKPAYLGSGITRTMRAASAISSGACLICISAKILRNPAQHKPRSDATVAGHPHHRPPPTTPDREALRIAGPGAGAGRPVLCRQSTVPPIRRTGTNTGTRPTTAFARPAYCGEWAAHRHLRADGPQGHTEALSQRNLSPAETTENNESHNSHIAARGTPLATMTPRR